MSAGNRDARNADVLLYLNRLSDMLDIDPLAAAQEKIGINARKYPPVPGL